MQPSETVMIDLTRKPVREEKKMKRKEKSWSVIAKKGKKLRSSVRRIVKIVLLSSVSARERTGRPLGTAVLARTRSAESECRESRTRSKGKLSATRGIAIALSAIKSALNVVAAASRENAKQRADRTTETCASTTVN